MNLSIPPNREQSPRPTARDVDDERSQQIAQIEAAVEAIGEGCEVARGVLGEVECVITRSKQQYVCQVGDIRS